MYEKTSDTNLKVTVQETTTKEQNYTLDFLKEQELGILKSINDFVDSKKAELQNIRILIDQCTELGVKSSAEIQVQQVPVEQAKVDSITLKQ